MIITIHQPQYLPWLGYFDKIHRAGVFVLLDDVQFKKNEWQNRNRIRTAQGSQWLTVPVRHDFGQMINDVEIDNKVSWSDKHQKALELNYGKAPYFDDYIGLFRDVFGKKWKNLVDINIHFVLQLIHVLKIKTKVVRSSECALSSTKTQRLVDLCLYFKADTYLAGAGGENYLDKDLFAEHGITVMTQAYRHPTYPQQWASERENAFISHLSVIDCLFNCGPQTLAVITGEKETH